MTPIEILPVRFDGKGLGYDIRINRGDVSVQEYLEALNEALLHLKLSRFRDDRGICRGCDGCCGERIPLTSVDVEMLSESPKAREYLSLTSGGNKDKLGQLLRRFCHIYVDGSSVDVTLRLTQENKCVFLNRDEKTCSIYDYRPLVCQTYFCCPVSPEASEVRAVLVNAGEDELVRRWLYLALESPGEFWYDEADDPNINPEDWVAGPFFEKRSYEEILLKEVLPVDLWDRIFRKIGTA